MSENSSDQAPEPIKKLAAASDCEVGVSALVPRDPDEVKKIEAELVQAGIQEPAAQRLAIKFVRKMHMGPLPPVEDFAGYEEACPGAAREILDMAVRQQKHAHEIEQKVVDAETFCRKSGVPAAIVVVLIIIAAVVICAIAGHDAVAGGLAAISLTTLVALFLKSDLLGANADGEKSEPKPEKAKPAPAKQIGTKSSRKRRS